MNETQSESLEQAMEAKPVSGIARRRLLRAGAAAVPVALTLSGRSAMANVSGGTCAKGLSPLAWNSLAPGGTNCKLASHTVTSSQLGASPVNWQPLGVGTLPRPWPSSCIPYAGYPNNPPQDTISSKWATGTAAGQSWQGARGQDTTSSKWATGTKYSQIFTGVSGYTESVSGISGKSVSLILLDNTGTVECHLCAAYLNAATGTGDVMTPQEVQNAYAGKVGSLTLSKTAMNAYLEQTWA